MKFLVFLPLILSASYAVEVATKYNKTADECVPPVLKFHKHIVAFVNLTKFNEHDLQNLRYGHFCSGIIIGPQTVLTTVSCVERYKVNSKNGVGVGIVAGSERERTTQIVPIANAIYIGIMELAIVTLSDKLLLDDIFVQSIDYTQKTTVKPGQICTLVGWAKLGDEMNVNDLTKKELRENCQFTTKIQYHDMVVLEKDMCGAGVSPFPRTFCAGGRASQLKQFGCNGDIGRPLFCDSKFAGMELWNLLCHGIKEPSYFIDIGEYSELIAVHDHPDYASKRSSGQNVVFKDIYFEILAVMLYLLL